MAKAQKRKKQKHRSLRFAVQIMQDIAAGKNMDDIISKYNGDHEFVRLWFTFLKANGWIEQKKEYDDDSGTLMQITEKGREWANKILVDSLGSTRASLA